MQHNNIIVVIPALKENLTDRCVNSILKPDSSSGFNRNELLLVDNSRNGWGPKYGIDCYRDPENHNIGVAGAWNVGVNRMFETNAEYTVILSTSLEFGPELHCTFRSELNKFWGAHVVETLGHSWHLIAIHRTVFEQVGSFDENFYPAYEEAIDFGYRMKIKGLEEGFTKIWVNAVSWGSANHIDAVDCPNPPLVKYYKQKWGGVKGEEKWVKPFNCEPLDFWEKRAVPELAEKYGLTVWW